MLTPVISTQFAMDVKRSKRRGKDMGKFKRLARSF